nr:2438_t:CDS:2 [Entrophospora candida]
MIEVGQAQIPRSFHTCGQFMDTIDNLYMFAKKYEYEMKNFYNDINQRRESIESIDHNWCKPTLGTPQFKRLIKKEMI